MKEKIRDIKKNAFSFLPKLPIEHIEHINLRIVTENIVRLRIPATHLSSHHLVRISMRRTTQGQV